MKTYVLGCSLGFLMTKFGDKVEVKNIEAIYQENGEKVEPSTNSASHFMLINDNEICEIGEKPEEWMKLSVDENQERLEVCFSLGEIISSFSDSRNFHNLYDYTLEPEEYKLFNKLMDEVEEDYADNFRFAKVGDKEQEKLYKKIQSKGCCGSNDFEVVDKKGVKYKFGYNFGH